MAYATVSTPANLGAVIDAMHDFLTDAAVGWSSVTDPGGSGTVLRVTKGTHAIEVEIQNRTTGDEITVRDGTSFSGTTLIGPSGNGDFGASDRSTVFNNDGPFSELWMFGDDTKGYAYFVIKQSDNRFRHFAGFGTLSPKAGDWTGGEFAYCHLPNTTSSAALEPQDANSQVLLDAGFDLNTTADADVAPTLRISGVPGHAGTWGVVGDQSMETILDATLGSRARIIGGSRGGPNVGGFGWLVQSSANQFIAIAPIDLYYLRPINTVAENDMPDNNQSVTRRRRSTVMLLGSMPDVGTIQMGNVVPEEVLTIGVSPSTEEWQAFPAVLKTSTGSNRSNNFGVAYRRGSLVTL